MDQRLEALFEITKRDHTAMLSLLGTKVDKVDYDASAKLLKVTMAGDPDEPAVRTETPGRRTFVHIGRNKRIISIEVHEASHDDLQEVLRVVSDGPLP